MPHQLNFQTSKADIGEIVIDKVGGFSEMEYPLRGVYVLECDNSPGYDPERFFRATMQRSIPDWAKTACNKVVYVGTSGDVVSRIHEHVIAEGAIFTRCFPPIQVLDIRKRTNLDLEDNRRGEMHRIESEIAKEYREQDVLVSTG